MIDQQFKQLAKQQSIVEPAALLAFIQVETGGKAFHSETGQLIIQFEPVWFRRKAPFAPSGLWSVNKVDIQSREWEAFNNAAAINKDAAMQATSIGLGQIMGFHYKRLGYESVNDMFIDANKGIDRQFAQIVKFIETDRRLVSAIRAKNWDKVASIYNGLAYKEMAKKWGREPYDISLQKAYNKLSKEV